jgi:hypothetical protein
MATARSVTGPIAASSVNVVEFEKRFGVKQLSMSVA